MTELPTAPAAAAAPPAAPPEARQFDFWLGDWDVTWGDGERGRNRVEAILDDRVIQENFDGQASAPLRGMSLSVYSPSLGLWRQTWVDNSGSYWAFSGGFDNGRMVLGTTDVREGCAVHLRMVWHNLGRDSLDWNWERSDDEGETWKVLWHLHYQRRAAVAPNEPAL
jgi:hypothetical protein